MFVFRLKLLLLLMLMLLLPQPQPQPQPPLQNAPIITPSGNDGSGIYKLTVKDVPVDGFWSISVYDAKGHFVKNSFDAYTLNNVTAKRGDDGAITAQFGGLLILREPPRVIMKIMFTLGDL